MHVLHEIFHVPWGIYWPDLITGVLNTLQYTIAGFVGSILFGLLLAIIRVWGHVTLAASARVIIEAFRNLPLITAIFITYFGLSAVGVTLSAFTAGTLALTGHYGAYLSEIFRSGIQSVDPGQTEAGMALGMSRAGIFKKILFPQAVRVALPGTATMLVDLLKGTSLMVTIGGAELMTQGRIITASTFRALEVYLVIGAIYFLLCFPLSMFLTRMEERLREGKPFTIRRRRFLALAQRVLQQ